MEPDIVVQMFPPVTRRTPALLLVSYGQSNLVFEVDRPEQLAQWLALLFRYRNEPDPPVPPEPLVVGRFGPYEVGFAIEGQDMMLAAVVTGYPKEIAPSLIIYIHKDSLDALADALAREHRQWVEHPAP